MKVTKRAKKTLIKYRKVEHTVSVYTCPTCKTEFHGGVERYVVSWYCTCGQKLEKG